MKPTEATMETKEITINIKLNIELSADAIDDIMCTALDGGISYWCRGVKAVGGCRGEYASEQIARGGSLILYDAESSDKWKLTPEKFLNGFKKWLKESGIVCVVGGHVDAAYIDADEADIIIQYALFGELVFS